MSLRKIRNTMLVRHGIDVTIQVIRKIFLKFKNTGKYEDQKRSGIISDIEIMGQCLVFPANEFIFQHHLVPCHRSASTIAFLANKNVPVLNWPGDFSDANHIENLWHIMKAKLRDMGPLTSEKMWASIEDVWYNIPSSVCCRLIDSMPRRLPTILTMKGYPTKY